MGNLAEVTISNIRKNIPTNKSPINLFYCKDSVKKTMGSREKLALFRDHFHYVFVTVINCVCHGIEVKDEYIHARDSRG
jgi:hypothetical protein